MAYDIPLTGFNTFNTNNLRLWKSRPFFKRLEEGAEDSDSSVEDIEQKVNDVLDAEYLTSIYYPNI